MGKKILWDGKWEPGPAALVYPGEIAPGMYKVSIVSMTREKRRGINWDKLRANKRIRRPLFWIHFNGDIIFI